MANTVVKMPQLGESVSEGTIGRWLKQPGDRVERDEPLVEIQTDKVNAEIPSPVAGILQEILLPEGTTAAVKTDMAIIGDTAAPRASIPPSEGPTLAPPAPTPSFSYDKSAGGGVVGQRDDDAAIADGTRSAFSSETVEGGGVGGKRFYTPVVLRMAQEHEIDLETVRGSGAHGRVTRKDVERAIAERGLASIRPAVAPLAPSARYQQPPAAETPSPAPPRYVAPPAPPQAIMSGDEVRALTPMRRAIADHMARARADIPDAWTLTEIDLTRLVRYRQSLLADWQSREGFALTYLPFFVKAVLAGLRAVPELNATFAGDRVVIHHDYHLGIAVSLDDGLVVPVLRDADQLSIAGIARALRTIIQMARSGRLALDDLQGASFTVNNPGALGSIMSQPIVPVGQSGIVTMEAIVKRPVVTADDAIAIRTVMNSCLSFDHRVLDGSGALRFLATVKEQLETVEYPLY
jgi:2-oxoisovalerate dehydrogenase E2 component (dihydrolipoyl transacylase)